MTAPNSFEEGPATYTVSLGNASVMVSLEQNHAIVRSIDVEIEQSDTRYSIVQTLVFGVLGGFRLVLA